MVPGNQLPPLSQITNSIPTLNQYSNNSNNNNNSNHNSDKNNNNNNNTTNSGNNNDSNDNKNSTSNSNDNTPSKINNESNSVNSTPSDVQGTTIVSPSSINYPQQQQPQQLQQQLNQASSIPYGQIQAQYQPQYQTHNDIRRPEQHQTPKAQFQQNFQPENNIINRPSSQAREEIGSNPKYASKLVVDRCTCRPEANHIPRPRNAFILFRQQHHQAVLDEGDVFKTNPDVSRELGRRWRDLSPEEKEYWNNLAEEEKKRHAEKYPGYRYIPRRFGKKGSCPFCRLKVHKLQQQPQHQQQFQQQQQQFQPQQQQQPQFPQYPYYNSIPQPPLPRVYYQQPQQGNFIQPTIHQQSLPPHLKQEGDFNPMHLSNTNSSSTTINSNLSIDTNGTTFNSDEQKKNFSVANILN